MSKSPNVAIIGAGIAGASCAFECARRGAAVTVFDKSTIASGSSGAAAGVVQPVTGRRAHLAPWHAEGLVHVGRLSALLQLRDGGRNRCGVLRAALTDDQATAWSKSAADFDPKVARWVDANEARAIEPHITRTVRGAIWVEHGLVIHVPSFVRALLEGAHAKCVENAHRLSIHEGSDDASISWSESANDVGGGAHADRETASFDAVIVAAGCGSEALVHDFDVTLDMVPAHGELLRFIGGPKLRTVVSSGGFVAPSPHGIIVGATNRWTELNAGVAHQGVQELEGKLAKLLHHTDGARPVAAWCGVRPATKNRVPRVGPIPGTNRLWTCTGHGAKGLLLGPISAAWLADAIVLGKDTIPERWLPV